MPYNRGIIFANGVVSDLSLIKKEILADDFIIAADGGTYYVLKLDLIPHAVIGDMDSLEPDTIKYLKENNVDIHTYPRNKDETDLELAVHYALDLGIKTITILGGLGNRWDMTFSNIFLLVNPRFSTPEIHLVIKDGKQEIFLARPDKIYQLNGKPGDIVSLIPIKFNALDVCTHDLKYPLNNEPLFLGSTRGVSNVMLSEQASVSFSSGLLLVFIIHI